MKGLSSVYIVSLLIFISSCSNNHSINSLSIKKNVKQIIFISDAKNAQQEDSYYDALIALKKEFPNEIKQMKVLTNDEGKKYFDSFQIKNSPAIIVIYNGKIMASIDGIASKDQILEPITEVLK